MIVIRTLGVFEGEWHRFEAFKVNLMKGYRDHGGDEQVVKNMLYLLDYNELIKMGPNCLMSNDDYLHFLIVLSGFPEVGDG